MLEIEVVNTYDGFLSLEGIWNNLLSKSDINIPFMTFEWMSIWWKNYGKASDLLILLIKNDGAVIGIAPLMKTRINLRGLSVKAITFIVNAHSNRAGFILIAEKKQAVHRIIDFLLKSDLVFDIILFDMVEMNSETDRNVAEVLEEIKSKHVRLPSNISPYIQIRGIYDQYLNAVSKNLKAKLNHIIRMMKETPDYRIIRYSNTDIEKAMSEVLEVSRETWQYDEGTAIASTAESTSFYSSLADVFGKKGCLELWVFKIKEQPIAFQFNLDFGNKIYCLKTGYKKEYSKLNAGKIIRRVSIENCFDGKKEEYDMLGDISSDKMRWTSLTRQHDKYYIYKSTVFGRALYFIESKVMPLARSLHTKGKM